MGSWRFAWVPAAVLGAAATTLYAFDVSAAADAACFGVAGLGGVLACLTGPRRRQARPAAAWPTLAVAVALFVAGAGLRPLIPTQALVTDALTLCSYACLGAFFAVLVRARGAVERHAALDGLIVCLAAGLASALLLAAPAVAPGQPLVVSALAGLFPVLDVVLLALAVHLTFTARVWPVSLTLLVASVALLLAGDVAHAVGRAGPRTPDSPLLDLPYLAALTLLAVAALHPSVAAAGRSDEQPAAAWSWRRMLLLTPAVLSPFVLLVTAADYPRRRLLIAVGGATLVVLLLARAVSAVRGQAEAQLHSQYQAQHDPLTGLGNRRLIAATVARLVAQTPAGGPRRVWVAALDLDGLKWVNDSWGHDAGDQLVIEVAGRLQALRGAEPPARVGGDQFLVAFAGDERVALRLVDEIQQCFATAVPVLDTEVAMTVSIGLAHAPGGGDAAAVTGNLLRDAVTAMHRSKAEGPGRATIFDASMHDTARERIELEGALRVALAEDQLTVVYQPIVRLESGRPCGAEALVRWTHPERGPIPPMTFIPVAERAGLIGELGDRVRGEALRRLAQWRADGTVDDDFYLSVNVSPRQLADPALARTVAAELRELGLPPAAVALELTEAALTDAGGVAARVLIELRELGVRLLVDDFGTGFSALGHLRRFPVTGVKIDRSFVAGLGEPGQDAEIVRAVVTMTGALGLGVVAEGVETRAQRDALAAAGVTEGQGWLWGPGVPAGDFAQHWGVQRHTAGPAPITPGNG